MANFVYMKQSSIRLIMILGTIAIIGIVIIQIYWIKRAWDTNEKQLDQSLYIALQNVAQAMFKYNNINPPADNPINQLSSNYYVINTNSEIDAPVLEYYLITEFKRLNLNIDFEYAIYDCSNDKMVYGNYINALGESLGKQEARVLPTYNGLVYYFGVYFPGRQNYLVNKMGIWIAFSTILLVAIIFFTYAMFIILKQRRLSELQKDFINNMTHEFKTPISSINISADVILDPDIVKQPERLTNYASLIKKENNRLNEQVEKVLNMARIERKGFSLSMENVDLHEVINTVAHSVSANKINKEVELQLNLQAQNTSVYADKLHLTNILFNLLDNAMKYSKETVIIKICTHIIGNNIELKISDNGIGINKEYQKKVFKKFYRVPTGNIHDVKGFGLGLYYVKYICHIHKWKIYLESTEDVGTIFSIIIPHKRNAYGK